MLCGVPWWLLALSVSPCGILSPTGVEAARLQPGSHALATSRYPAGPGSAAHHPLWRHLDKNSTTLHCATADTQRSHIAAKLTQWAECKVTIHKQPIEMLGFNSCERKTADSLKVDFFAPSQL